MISTNSTLLERPETTAVHSCGTGTSNGIELALFRARGAMMDGWAFTPEGVQAYIGPAAWQDGNSPYPSPRQPDEDELEETALYFGD